MEHETFFTLMCSLPHWEFEIFLMFVFDILIGTLLWPLLRKWTNHHKSDDQQLVDLQCELAKIKEHLGIKDK